MPFVLRKFPYRGIKKAYSASEKSLTTTQVLALEGKIIPSECMCMSILKKKNYSSMEAPCDCVVGITRPSLPSLFFLKHSMVIEYTDSYLDIQIVVEGVNFFFLHKATERKVPTWTTALEKEFDHYCYARKKNLLSHWNSNNFARSIIIGREQGPFKESMSSFHKLIESIILENELIQLFKFL